MNSSKSAWLDVLNWMQKADALLPNAFPPELPAESSPEFWFQVARIEMTTRDTLSAKLRSPAVEQALSSMTALEAWLSRRRFEWAAQVALSKVQEGVEPEAPLSEILDWLLVDSWESDGCIALWNHAERGGKPHPSNPDGLSPI